MRHQREKEDQMFRRPSIALLVTILACSYSARAAVTYVSQDRYVGVGSKQQRTFVGASMGVEERPPSIQSSAQATDFGPFSKSLTNVGGSGFATLTSTLEPTHLTAIGSTFAGLTSIGNLYENWGYGIARNIIVFD